jgi:hypothetical protein
MLTIYVFYAFGGSSSGSSSSSVNQRSKWRLLVCLTEQGRTKITSEQRFSERKPHTLKQEKKQRKPQAPAMFRYQRVDGWIQMTERY